MATTEYHQTIEASDLAELVRGRPVDIELPDGSYVVVHPPGSDDDNGDPKCWVCREPATHVNTGMVGTMLGRDIYTCDEHAIDIDDTPLEDVHGAIP